MDHKKAEAAAHVGRTIAEQAMKDVFAQTQMENMDKYQQIVAAAAAAQEVYRLVAYLGVTHGSAFDAVRLADSYRQMGVALGVRSAAGQ